jgi:DNA repair protein RadC
MSELSRIGGLTSIAVNERPQERLESKGPSALSDSELLAMLLRSGSKGMDVLQLSRSLIKEAGSLNGLLSWQVEDFKRHRGIGHIKALQMITVLEVARRILRQQAETENRINSSEKVFQLMAPICTGLKVEKFWVLCLNRKNKLLKTCEVTSGTATSSLVHPREVFFEAIRSNATAIIATHNHPSGDPTPSSADFKITEQLKEAAKTLKIDFLDHIIIGTPHGDLDGDGYYSFAESGML